MGDWHSKISLFLRLLRIKDWRAYLLIVLLGFIISEGFLFPFREIFFFWLIIFSFLGFGFSINECYDTKEDRLHKEKEKFFIGKKLTFKKGIIISFITALLGLAFSAYFGFKIFLFALFSLLLGLFYSVPPLRFKERPFLDLISHGLFAGALLFLFPLIVFKKEFTSLDYFLTLSIFYLSVILELRNHLEDYPSDKKAKLKTVACFLGYQKTENFLKYLAFFYPLILLPIFLSISYLLFLYFYFFTLFFFLAFLLSKDLLLGKNYRIFDIYIVFCFGTVLLVHL